MKLQITLLSLIALYWSGVYSYSKGAPPSACGDMVPQHGKKPLPLNSFPYQVTTKTGSIQGGERVPITIKAPEDKVFKGFFVQARAGDEIIGKFEAEPNLVGLVDCLGGTSNAATHVDGTNKTTVTVYWTAPKKPIGNLKYRVTVAENGGRYWVGYESPSVSVV